MKSNYVIKGIASAYDRSVVLIVNPRSHSAGIAEVTTTIDVMFVQVNKRIVKVLIHLN